MNSKHRAALAVATFSLFLIACSPDAPPAADTTTANAALPSEISAAPGINAPIPAADISTRLELAVAPVHVAASDTLRVAVRVHNDGRAPLVSEGSAPVNLGAMLIGPEGPDKAPGNRDFVRMKLPLISPGQSVDVVGELPVASLLDLPVRLELVQEGVNWFAEYGQPSLDLGTFRRCSPDATPVCDSNGQPLASE
jgi:hypothetical protein